MKLLQPLVALSLATILWGPGLVWAAGDGHGHDHGDSAPAAAGPALPRFAAVSELFELVGVLNGKQITLYLDRVADNSPVTEAKIELEIAGKKFLAQVRQGLHGADEFEVVLPEAPKPGVLPITAMVNAGPDADLLAGEFDIRETAHSHSDEAAQGRSWKRVAGWAAGGIGVLAALVVAGRRLLWPRRVRVGGAA